MNRLWLIWGKGRTAMKSCKTKRHLRGSEGKFSRVSRFLPEAVLLALLEIDDADLEESA
jgi:hypothetical protein